MKNRTKITVTATPPAAKNRVELRVVLTGNAVPGLYRSDDVADIHMLVESVTTKNPHRIVASPKILYNVRVILPSGTTEVFDFSQWDLGSKWTLVSSDVEVTTSVEVKTLASPETPARRSDLPAVTVTRPGVVRRATRSAAGRF